MSTADATNAAATLPTPRPVIYLTGDSLTERGTDPDNAGWVALLQDRYNRSADIVARGLSGYNTKWFIESALPVVERELSGEVRLPSLVTLWLGANDAALPDGTAARQHVPLATYKENLATIVRAFQNVAPQTHVLLITPPHVDDAVRKSRSPIGCAERTNAAAGEYARACVDVAREIGVDVLDLYSFFNAMSDSERAACLDDGLHFTAKGNRLVDEQLQIKINKAFPDLAKQLEAWQLPNFRIWMNALVPVVVAVAAVYVATYFGAWEQVARRYSRPVLYLLGDSITESGVNPDKSGWVALLQHRYQRSTDVLPRGLSGYNTKWFIEFALPVIKRELSGGGISPSLITLWLGANDAALTNGPSARQHVPLETYAANLEEIVYSLRASAPDAALLLITPPHVDDAARQMRSKTGRLDRSNAMAGEYARACVETAAKLGVTVLDVHSLFNSMSARERTMCLEDGLHLSAWGNRLMERLLRAKIADAFPVLMSRLEVWEIPNWDRLP
ncbi:hypothetical protein PI125_g5058 [Phytophthora idaei]|nr:hypothetical protein PI125_g5058 [Phytophthora idaei]